MCGQIISKYHISFINYPLLQLGLSLGIDFIGFYHINCLIMKSVHIQFLSGKANQWTKKMMQNYQYTPVCIHRMKYLISIHQGETRERKINKWSNSTLVPVYSFLIDTCAPSIFATLELYFDTFLLILLYHSDYTIVNISIFESCDIEGLEKRSHNQFIYHKLCKFMIMNWLSISLMQIFMNHIIVQRNISQ